MIHSEICGLQGHQIVVQIEVLSRDASLHLQDVYPLSAVALCNWTYKAMGP